MVIDAHHHFVPEEILTRLRSENKEGGRRLVTDTISITLRDDLFDTDAQMHHMSTAGIDAAVFHQCALNVFGTEVCAIMNDAGQHNMRRYPGRFLAAAHVAVQDGDRGVRELERAVEELGLTAVALPTSTLGIFLDDPRMDPFLTRINDWQIPLILHPALRPQGAETRYQMERSLGREFDIAGAVVRLIYQVLPRYPQLRCVIPHSGGAMTFLKGRIEMFYEPPTGEGVPPELKELAKTRREQAELNLHQTFNENFRRLYFDCCGHGAWSPALRFLLEVVGADRIVLGTDYPLEAKNAQNLLEYRELIDSLHLTPENNQAILGDTMAGLLGIRQ